MVQKLGIVLDPTKLLPQPAVSKEADIIKADYTETEE
jgi:hypothetical protein